ncbi:MAG: hypothetical protein QMD78_02820 [Methanocellales archaeon]|nr:hypothetical protein [Methanocellales archaeon]
MGEKEDEILKRFVDLNLPEPEVGSENKRYYHQVLCGIKKAWLGHKELRELVEPWHQFIKSEISPKSGFLKASSILTIDCVCTIDKRAWILEVKYIPKQGADKWEQALGQILIYAELFAEDHPEYEDVKKGVIINKEQWHPYIEPVYEMYGIELFKV